jgi:N-acetylglucosaminyldiphosphoundecaprenol N-acetyl-beta-D-mannosaminyltransferase
VIRKIDQIATSSLKKMFLVVTVNPEFIMQAQSDRQFKQILNSADLAIPDGHGLRLKSANLQIVPGRKVVQALVETRKYKIFFLGGREGVAQAMAEKYGGDYDAGHQDIRSQLLDAQENERVLEKINKYKPDILLVAYGAPWQEKWLWKYKPQLQAKLAMGVGGTFDYLTNRAKLPPQWVETAGLEWLWRLIHEPRRVKRQLSLVKFFFLTHF